MFDTDIMFLGGVFPKHMEKEINDKSKGTMQNAANAFQWHIIKGIEKNIGKPINILNLMFIGSYPNKYKDIFIKKFKFSHIVGANDFNVGFCNLTIVKQLLLPIVVKNAMKSWLLNNKKNDKKVLIVYSLQSYFLQAAQFAKRINKNVHICFTVNDLPIFMNMDKEKYLLYKYYKKWSINNLNKNLKYIDSFMLVTEQISNYLKINDKPYVVVEGMVDSDDFVTDEINLVQTETKIKKILYTGTLTKQYGILNLLEAFKLIEDENYQLIICGGGETEANIINAAEHDKRIKFKGLLPRDIVLKLQKEATILVNPRQNNEEFTKYSFPYKMIEYLLAGKPIVCYKLDGIPSSYNKHLSYVDGDGIIKLKDKILEICSLDFKKRQRVGMDNIKFVKENKNNIVQSKKLLEMIFNTK